MELRIQTVVVMLIMISRLRKSETILWFKIYCRWS